MGLCALLLLLLLTLASPWAGTAKSCENNNDFVVKQPSQLSTLTGGSVYIPCSFNMPWEQAKLYNVEVFWRRNGKHGEYIYNKTQSFTHDDFKDRLFSEWIPKTKNGYLIISHLRKGDATTYFCQVLVKTSCGLKVGQSTLGTNLTITPVIPQVSGSGYLNVGAVTGVVMLSVVLKVTVLGLSCLLWN